MFIFDGGDVEFTHNNPKVPSEVELAGPMKEKKPKIILVPESRINEVRELLEKDSTDIEVLPIESLEVI